MMPSRLESLVLRSLRAGAPLYGLQIVRASDGQISVSSVYTTLYRMQNKGLVTVASTGSPPHSGLPRPRYRITALGKRALLAAELMQ